jgi:translocator protein
MRLILFLSLNFGALILGALFMGGSPADNQWYSALNQAPWTPPGWVFGVAWTTIMVCYSIYLYLNFSVKSTENWKRMTILFLIQWVLNIGWNPVFFAWHQLLLGCVIIAFLILVLIIFHINFNKKRGLTDLLILPYLLWLCVAFSLNLYSVLYN